MNKEIGFDGFGERQRFQPSDPVFTHTGMKLFRVVATKTKRHFEGRECFLTSIGQPSVPSLSVVRSKTFQQHRLMISKKACHLKTV